MVRLTIDAVQFAGDGSSMQGEIAPDGLPRVRDLGAIDGGAWYCVTGQRSMRGRPALRVQVRCAVTLLCQRCLEPFEYDVDQAVELELSADQREIDAAEDDTDRVLASPTLDVIELVEDEILLALPMVARHAACELTGDTSRAVDEHQSGPWAALKRLKHS